MRRLWRQSCLFKQIGSSAAAVLVIDDTAIAKKTRYSTREDFSGWLTFALPIKKMQAGCMLRSS